MKTLFNLFGLTLIYIMFINKLNIALEWIILAMLIINAFFIGLKWLKIEKV